MCGVNQSVDGVNQRRRKANDWFGRTCDGSGMAPRAPESKEWFIKRLRSTWKGDGSAEVRFGAPHFSHGVVLEDGKVRVRCLVMNEEKVTAYRAQHASFMPEHAEMLSDPTGAIVYEAESLEELVGLIERGRWPL